MVFSFFLYELEEEDYVNDMMINGEIRVAWFFCRWLFHKEEHSLELGTHLLMTLMECKLLSKIVVLSIALPKILSLYSTFQRCLAPHISHSMTLDTPAKINNNSFLSLDNFLLFFFLKQMFVFSPSSYIETFVFNYEI